MTKVDQNSVNATFSKLPLEIINRLLVACNKDCELLPLDDAHSPRKALKNNREKLTRFIVEFDDCDTYNRAKEIADSLTQKESLIEDLKEELKPIEGQCKELKVQIKQLKAEKQALIDGKVKELEEALSTEDSGKITQYNTVVEKLAAESQNQKQMKKALNEVAKGFIASEIAEVTEEFVEAVYETNKVTEKIFNKLRDRVKQNKERRINFDTVEGLNKVNEQLEQEWKTHQTNIINKTRLNPDWKKNREVINNSNDIAIAA